MSPQFILRSIWH